MSTYVRATLFPLSILLLLLASACPDDTTGEENNEPMACTEIGCSDMLSVTLRAEEFFGEDYTVNIDNDGQMSSCTLSLSDECDSGDVCLSGGDCKATRGQDEGSFVLQLEAYESVTISVERNGAELVNETLTPMYDTVQPNGEGCEPICKQGQAELTLIEPS